MTLVNLTGHSAAELVGIYNGLNPNTPLTSWKKSKAVLIEQIEDLRVKALTKTNKEIKTKYAVLNNNKTGRTIRAASIELLCLVAFHEDRDEKPDDGNRVEADAKSARSVGIPYDEIIRRIVAEFPDCQTTVACLRWYSVKIRVEEYGYEGLRLPQRRPRVKPAKRD